MEEKTLVRDKKQWRDQITRYVNEFCINTDNWTWEITGQWRNRTTKGIEWGKIDVNLAWEHVQLIL